MSWNPLDEPIDWIVLGGVRSPGLADVVGANSPRKWDERGGYGLSGAIVWFHGLGLSHFSVRFRLYTDQDWEEWREFFLPLVAKPPLGKRPKALDIWHPLLQDLGIRAVVVEDVLQPEQTNDGEWTAEIKFIEFRRPKFGMGKPDAAEATPADPVEQEIEANSATIDALAGP